VKNVVYQVILWLKFKEKRFVAAKNFESYLNEGKMLK